MSFSMLHLDMLHLDMLHLGIWRKSFSTCPNFLLTTYIFTLNNRHFFKTGNSKIIFYNAQFFRQKSQLVLTNTKKLGHFPRVFLRLPIPIQKTQVGDD